MNLAQRKTEALEVLAANPDGIASAFLADRLTGTLAEGMQAIKALAAEKKIHRRFGVYWQIAPAPMVFDGSAPFVKNTSKHDQLLEERTKRQRLIVQFLRGKGVIKRKVIHRNLSRHSSRMLDQAMSALRVSGEVVTPKSGYWCLPAEQPEDWTPADIRRFGAI